MRYFKCICISVTCDTVSSPSNGKVTLDSVDSTTVANFECGVGYTLAGSDKLTCRATGAWDFSEPSCGMTYCSQRVRYVTVVVHWYSRILE